MTLEWKHECGDYLCIVINTGVCVNNKYANTSKELSFSCKKPGLDLH